MKSGLRKFLFMSACLGVATCFGQPGFSESVNNFDEYSQSFDMSALETSNSATTNDTGAAVASSGAQGDQSRNTVAQYTQPQDQTNYSTPQLKQSCNGNLAGASVNNLPVPSGSYNFGFTGGLLGTVKSIFSKGGYLPPTSTGSVELTVAQ